MVFTRKTIGEWFDIGKTRNQKYMLVYIEIHPAPVHSFPVFARDMIDYWQKHDDPFYSAYNGHWLVEVFDLSLDKEMQMRDYPNVIRPPRLAE